jgi:hypothetical protein
MIPELARLKNMIYSPKGSETVMLEAIFQTGPAGVLGDFLSALHRDK